MSLEAGIERSDEFEVAGVLLTDVGVAAQGTRCLAHAVLREVVDGRKLRFDVEVRDGDRTIGAGTHERRVVDSSGFGA